MLIVGCTTLESLMETIPFAYTLEMTKRKGFFEKMEKNFVCIVLLQKLLIINFDV